MGRGGRWEGDSGCETHVNPWLIHGNVWQKPLQYCKVISLQIIKIIGEKKKKIKPPPTTTTKTKSLPTVAIAMKLKDACLLEGKL